MSTTGNLITDFLPVLVGLILAGLVSWQLWKSTTARPR